MMNRAPATLKDSFPRSPVGMHTGLNAGKVTWLTPAILAGLLFLSSVAPAFAQQETVSGRTPSAVMSYRGATWLERPTRDEEEQPYKVIEVMNLKDGDVVCDMGCGTGYFARKIAKEVAPSGKVYGVDIQPEMLDLMEQYCKDEGVTNVIPILGEPDDPMLPKGKLDWIILADVFHEFQAPQKMLAKMIEALKPDGKVVLLEYRAEDDSGAHIKPDHRMSVEQVLAEWNPAGFELVNLLEFLPSQHLFIFGKDPDREDLFEEDGE